jgi:alpha-glucosidase
MAGFLPDVATARTWACRCSLAGVIALAHHDGSRVWPGDPRLGDEVEFWLWADPAVTAVTLRAAPEGEEETWPLRASEAAGHVRWRRWSTKLKLQWPELRYRFRLRREQPGRPPEHWWLTGRALHRHTPLDAGDFLLRALDGGPCWLAGTVFYEIFPDRFARGEIDRRPQAGKTRGRLGAVVHREWHEPPLPWAEAHNLDFHGGDLDGLRGRLDHLETLGVNGLYITPIFASLTNHRYDTVDHAVIDPTVGGEAALERLSAELRRRGMRYLLDAVVNHVGSGHRWFNREGLYPERGAYQDAQSSTARYFRFDDRPPCATLFTDRGMRSCGAGSGRPTSPMATVSTLPTWSRAIARCSCTPRFGPSSADRCARSATTSICSASTTSTPRRSWVRVVSTAR